MNKHLFKCFLLYCILSLSSQLHAQWKDVGLPFGYSANTSYIDYQGNIILKAREKFYYSEDRGFNWKQIIYDSIQNYINKGTKNNFWELYNHDILWRDDYSRNIYRLNKLTNHFDLHTKAKSNYYLGTDRVGNSWYASDGYDNNIFYTKDGGNNYEEFQLAEKISGHYFIDSYKDIFTLILRDYGKLYRYETKTNLIDSIYKFNAPNQMFISQVTGSVFVQDGGKLFRSIDNGNSFLDVNLPFVTKYSLTISLSQNGSLFIQDGSSAMYRSLDDGLTWINMYTLKVSGKSPRYLIQSSLGYFHSIDTLIAFDQSSFNQGCYTSIDNGATWTVKADNLFEPGFLKLNIDLSGNLYATTLTDSTILMSKDTGLTWEKFYLKYKTFDYPIYDIGINELNDIYAVTKISVFRSTNGGSSFDKLQLPWSSQETLNYHYQVFSSFNYVYLLSEDYSSFFSDDKGDTWKMISVGNDISGNIQIDFKGNLYFRGFSGLVKYNPSINKSISYVPGGSFDVTKSGIAYLLIPNATNQDLYISKDKAPTTEKIEIVPAISAQINSVFVDLNGSVYIQSNDQKIYASDDDGHTFYYFTEIPKKKDSLNEFYTLERQFVFAKIYTPFFNVISLYNSKLGGELLRGKVYYDQNNNCTLEDSESIQGIFPISIIGKDSFVFYSGNDGRFSYRFKEGQNKISVLPINPLWEACPSSMINILPNKNDTLFLDLGLKAKELCPYLRLQMQAPIMRRCFKNSLYLKYSNEGTDTAYNAVVSVILNDKMEYLSSTVSPTSQNGQKLTYNIPNIGPGATGQIVIYFKLDCNSLNEQICINGEIEPAKICNTLLPDLSKQEKCYVATSSYDPNDKTAYVNGKPANGQTDVNQDIEYVIRFQNTGTDTAFWVSIVDDIPEGFDMRTLTPLNSSHPYKLNIQGRKIRFTFDPIMLPDSNTNEASSHGFVAFKISINKDLPIGTKLDNSANIFFDYNLPVLTNTAFLAVANVTSTLNINDGIKFHCFPNPVKGELNIFIDNNKSGTYSIRIIDILGHEIIADRWKGDSNSLHVKSEVQAGLYFINIEDNKGRHGYGKFVLE